MDNNRSYFENKIVVKQKVKKRFKKIRECVELIEKIESGYFDNSQALDEQAIRFLNERIEEIKEKTNKETNIYLYG